MYSALVGLFILLLLRGFQVSSHDAATQGQARTMMATDGQDGGKQHHGYDAANRHASDNRLQVCGKQLDENAVEEQKQKCCQ